MYITATEYNEYTGEDASQATDLRIQRASRLLDARIGYHPDREDYKLTVDDLKAYQQDAVKMWVSWMVKGLVDNNDSIETDSSIKLGRFSIGEDSGGATGSMPDALKYADIQLKDAGLIRREIPTNRNQHVEAGYYI